MKGQTLQEWAGASQIFGLVFTDIVDSTSLAAKEAPSPLQLIRAAVERARTDFESEIL